MARVDNYVVRVALFDGEYYWHKHVSDELFYVYKGRVVIQLRDQPSVTLCKGELVVIPQGVEHCPKSLEPSYVLMFEEEDLQTKKC